MALRLSPRRPDNRDRPDIKPENVEKSNLKSLASRPLAMETSSIRDIPTATSTPSSAAAATTTAPAPAAATASQSSDSDTGTSPAKVVTIVVPIVACILLIPLIFLLYRSHQMKRAAQKRQSQRSSTEAMLQRPSSISKGPPQIEQFRNLATSKAPEGQSRGGLLRPANTLGLFNFNLWPSPSPRNSTPMTAMTPGVTSPSGIGSPPHRLSVAHLVPMRRSQASVIDDKRPPTGQSNERQAQSNENLPEGPRDSADPNFAPLNRIGTAHTRSSSRHDLHRKASEVSAISRPSDESLHPSNAHGRPYDRPPPMSNGDLPPMPPSGLGWGGRFTISDYEGGDRTDRHSDVSALTDDDEHDRRMSQRSHIISSIQDDAGMQPFRVL